jgi:hypothetical protein
MMICGTNSVKQNLYFRLFDVVTGIETLFPLDSLRGLQVAATARIPAGAPRYNRQNNRQSTALGADRVHATPKATGHEMRTANEAGNHHISASDSAAVARDCGARLWANMGYARRDAAPNRRSVR